eukprot:gene10289-8212_t
MPDVNQLHGRVHPTRMLHFVWRAVLIAVTLLSFTCTATPGQDTSAFYSNETEVQCLYDSDCQLDSCLCNAGSPCFHPRDCGQGLYCNAENFLAVPMCKVTTKCSSCKKNSQSITDSCDGSCPSGDLDNMVFEGGIHEFIFLTFSAAEISSHAYSPTSGTLELDDLSRWARVQGFNGSQVQNIIQALDNSGRDPIPVSSFVNSLAGTSSLSLICPVLPPRGGGVKPAAVVFPGCPCNATTNAASFQCPAGHRCSPQAYHGLATSKLKQLTTVELKAVCVACVSSQYCPQGSFAKATTAQLLLRSFHAQLAATALRTVIYRIRNEKDPMKGNICPPGATKPNTICPAGFYCPSPSEQIICPNGYYCKGNPSLRCFPSGKLNAVMGPSGSGKTTFLNVLAGRTGGDVTITGKVHVNGAYMKIKKLKKVTGFVPQDDIVHEDLSVRENLYYSADLMLPRSVADKRRRAAIIDDVLDMMQLRHIEHFKVGSVEKRGISGGQRKRVNIGLELVSQPTVLFLDEPTSGLDSTASSDILKSLSDMAGLGMTVVSVIHQPRFSSYMLFDQADVYMGQSRRFSFSATAGRQYTWDRAIVAQVLCVSSTSNVGLNFRAAGTLETARSGWETRVIPCRRHGTHGGVRGQNECWEWDTGEGHGAHSNTPAGVGALHYVQNEWRGNKKSRPAADSEELQQSLNGSEVSIADEFLSISKEELIEALQATIVKNEADAKIDPMDRFASLEEELIEALQATIVKNEADAKIDLMDKFALLQEELIEALQTMIVKNEADAKITPMERFASLEVSGGVGNIER